MTVAVWLRQELKRVKRRSGTVLHRLAFSGKLTSGATQRNVSSFLSHVRAGATTNGDDPDPSWSSDPWEECVKGQRRNNI